MPKFVSPSPFLGAYPRLVAVGSHMALAQSRQVVGAPLSAATKAIASIQRFRNNGSSLDPNNPQHVRAFVQVAAAGFERVSPQRVEAYFHNANVHVTHGLTNTLVVLAVLVRNFPGGLDHDLLDKVKTPADLEDMATVGAGDVDMSDFY